MIIQWDEGDVIAKDYFKKFVNWLVNKYCAELNAWINMQFFTNKILLWLLIRESPWFTRLIDNVVKLDWQILCILSQSKLSLYTNFDEVCIDIFLLIVTTLLLFLRNHVLCVNKNANLIKNSTVECRLLYLPK